MRAEAVVDPLARPYTRRKGLERAESHGTQNRARILSNGRSKEGACGLEFVSMWPAEEERLRQVLRDLEEGMEP